MQSRPRIGASQYLYALRQTSDVTHLTIDPGHGGVKSNEVENYGHEGAHARKGVDLPNGKFSSCP